MPSDDVPVVTGTQAQPTTRRRVRRKKAADARQAAEVFQRQQARRHAREAAAARQAAQQASQPKVGPLAREAHQLALLRYDPQTRALGRQSTRVPGYFTDYRNHLSAIQQGLVGNPATGQLGGAYGAGLNSVNQLGTNLAQGSANVIAAARGQQIQGAVAGTTPNQGVLDDAAKAAAVRGQMLGGFGGLITAQGLNEGAYLSNRAASSAAQEIQAKQQAAQALTDAEGDRALYETQTLSDLRKARRDAKAAAAADLQKLRGALAIAGIRADTVLATNRQDNRAGARQDANTLNKWGYTNAEWRQMSSQQRQQIIKSEAGYGKSSTGTGNGLTPAQQRAQHQDSQKAISRVHDARAAIGTTLRTKDKNGNTPTAEQARDYLIRQGRYTAEELNLAFAIRRGHPLTKAQRAAAHRLGIRAIPKRWKRGRQGASFNGAVNQSPGGDVNQGADTTQ